MFSAGHDTATLLEPTAAMFTVQDWGYQPAIVGELMRPHDSLRIVSQVGFDLAM